MRSVAATPDGGSPATGPADAPPPRAAPILDAFASVFPDPASIRLSQVSVFPASRLEIDPTAIVTDDRGVYYYSPGRAPILSFVGDGPPLVQSDEKFFSNDSYLDLGSFLKTVFVRKLTRDKTFWNHFRQYRHGPAASLPGDLSTYFSYYDPSVVGALTVEGTTIAFATSSYVYLGKGILYHSIDVAIFDGKPHHSVDEIEALIGKVLALPSQPYSRQVYVAQRGPGGADLVYFNGLAFLRNAAPFVAGTMLGDYYSVNSYTFVASYRYDSGDKKTKPDPHLIATTAADPRRATFRLFTTDEPIADARGHVITPAGATTVFGRLTLPETMLPQAQGL